MEIAEVVTPGQAGAFGVSRRAQAGLAALPAFHRRLLDDAVTAALATVNARGRVQLTPVWCHADDDYVYLNSVRGRLKDRNVRARPEVSLLLVDPDDPYHWISVEGAVTVIIDEDDPQQGHRATDSINALSACYLREPVYPLRDPGGEVRVLYGVTPSRVLTFGAVPD